jgi:hypothetical protein
LYDITALRSNRTAQWAVADAELPVELDLALCFLGTYTKEMLGIRGQTEEQQRAEAELGLETTAMIAEDGTFVHPKVEDEVEDWGNRARLLQAYRALRKELP